MWGTVVSGLLLWLEKLEKLEKVLIFHLGLEKLEELILLMKMLAGKAEIFFQEHIFLYTAIQTSKLWK